MKLTKAASSSRSGTKRRAPHRAGAASGSASAASLSAEAAALHAAALPRLLWLGASDEAGEFRTCAQGAAARGAISQAAAAYLSHEGRPESPLAWFQKSADTLRWQDPIKDPLAVLAETTDPAATEDQKISRLLCPPGVAALYEAVLEKGLRAGDTCGEFPPERLARETLRQLLLGLPPGYVDASALERRFGEVVDAACARLSVTRDASGRAFVSSAERGVMDRQFFAFLMQREGGFYQIPLAWSPGADFTEEQRVVYGAVLQHLRERGWAVLSGPGGAGKTHMLRALAASARARVGDEGGDVHVYFLGPTNRAVSVLVSGIGDLAEGQTAGTIHSVALRKDLPAAHVVVIDESSMLASEHGDLLLRCPSLSRAAFLFVGDHVQLPPVGSGELLRPLLAAARLPSLTQNLRASCEGLAAAVRAVRSGASDEMSTLECRCAGTAELLERVVASDCDLVLCLRNEERIRINAHAIQKRPLPNARLAALDDYRKVSETWDGTPPFPRSFVPFVGMPVRLQNNEHRPLFCRGMLGKVTLVSLNGRVWTVHCLFEGNVLELQEGLFALPEHLRPAFATTLHDAQGAQGDRVAIVLPRSARCPLLSLESLYTAASRAKRELLFFSHGDTMEDMQEHFRGCTRLRRTPLALLLECAASAPSRDASATPCAQAAAR